MLNLGWFASFRTQVAIDQDGQPLPWYTYSAINFLEERLTADMRVFEYGSGNSTLWYSKRVKQVVAVESDSEWYAHVSLQLPEKDQISYRIIGQDYIHEPELHEPFDIVVIDGYERSQCAVVAERCLRDEGVILWDDSDLEEHRSGYEYLIKHGFSELKLFGLAPITFLTSQTSIFYKAGHNVLKI